MIHTFVIQEGIVLAKLLKPANVMKQGTEQSQLPGMFRKSSQSAQPVHNRYHCVGMDNF